MSRHEADRPICPEPVRCSADGCDAPASEALFLRDYVGHVHDCPAHGAEVREWCDVVSSAPLIDGECQVVSCTPQPIYTVAPALLGDAPPSICPECFTVRAVNGECGCVG